MLHALLICTDEDCTDVFEARGSLEELEALACDCGCALHVVSLMGDYGDRASGFELAPAA